MRRKKRQSDAFLDLSDILRDYGLLANRDRAIRRLNMTAYNYSKVVGMGKPARIARLLKRELSKRR